MKRSRFLLFLGILALSLFALNIAPGQKPASAAAGAMAYKLDGAHTSVYFRITHLGMSFIYGRFNNVSGRIAVGDDSTFDFSVKTADIDTNHAKRDNHLRSPDFFNARQFPTITFKSTEVHGHGEEIQVTGDLTLHGVNREISFHMKKMGEGSDPWGNERIGFATEFTIKRSNFGMTKMLNVVGDDVDLMISFEGIRGG